MNSTLRTTLLLAVTIVVLYHDKYFLFSSHAAGYSYSDNLINR